MDENVLQTTDTGDRLGLCYLPPLSSYVSKSQGDVQYRNLLQMFDTEIYDREFA